MSRLQGRWWCTERCHACENELEAVPRVSETHETLSPCPSVHWTRRRAGFRERGRGPALEQGVGTLVVRVELLPFRNDNPKDQSDGMHEMYRAQHLESDRRKGS